MQGPEYALAELPLITCRKSLGYGYLSREANEDAREGLNNVILRDIFFDSIQRINHIDGESARAVYQELLAVRGNERWMNILRDTYSKVLLGDIS